MFNPFSLAGRRLVVTGASSGIGREIAVCCARMGASVIGVGRDDARLDSTLSVLNDHGGRDHVMVKADLTEDFGREAVLSALGNQPVHGVVHSAGISRLAPVRQITEKHMREVQAINVEAPVLMTQALLRRNLVHDGGSILFIASIAAHIGVPGVGAYSGTKAALLAITRCLAMEVAKRSIRANCLSPALVETPLFARTIETAGADSVARQRANYPLGFGTTADVAHAAVFFLSDASRWVTGTTLVMDGGLTIT